MDANAYVARLLDKKILRVERKILWLRFLWILAQCTVFISAISASAARAGHLLNQVPFVNTITMLLGVLALAAAALRKTISPDQKIQKYRSKLTELETLKAKFLLLPADAEVHTAILSASDTVTTDSEAEEK